MLRMLCVGTLEEKLLPLDFTADEREGVVDTPPPAGDAPAGDVLAKT